jgi:hypothetical protein
MTEPCVIQVLRERPELALVDGEPVRFVVHVSDILDAYDTLREERDHYMIVGLQRLDRICAAEAQLAAARTVTDAMINKGWLLLQTSCIENHKGLLDMVEREDFADALTAALTQDGA